MPNFSPKFWGPSAWKFLHSVVFSLEDKIPKDRQIALHAFFTNLQHVLPCASCRKHYADALKTPELAISPLTFSSGKKASRWLFDMHNKVNRDTGKAEPEFESVEQAYTGNSQNFCSNKCQSEAQEISKKLSSYMVSKPTTANAGVAGGNEKNSDYVYLAGALAFVLLLFAGLSYWNCQKTKKNCKKNIDPFRQATAIRSG